MESRWEFVGEDCGHPDGTCIIISLGSVVGAKVWKGIGGDVGAVAGLLVLVRKRAGVSVVSALHSHSISKHIKDHELKTVIDLPSLRRSTTMKQDSDVSFLLCSYIFMISLATLAPPETTLLVRRCTHVVL